MRSEAEVRRVIDLYADTVKRLCMIYLKNEADTEDIFQTVFLKYFESKTKFENEAHEKAWIIRVTINCCKDLLKNFFRSKTVSLEEYIRQQPGEVFSEKDSEVLEAVLALPEKYRNVIYLYYYEEYSAQEISDILKKNVNTIYTWLTRSKKKLKAELEMR
nr:sigma-70 family RNA polymerase sigma factor [uncultured Faecalimonas sp.]